MKRWDLRHWGRSAAHYRPAALTLAGVLVVLVSLPTKDGALPPAIGRAAGVTTEQATGTRHEAAPTPTTVPAPSRSTPAPYSPSRLVTDVAPRPAPPGPVTSAPDPPGPRAPVAPRIIRVAWASASAGSPVAATGVPEGTLPVGTRLGLNDKSSFLAFTATPDVLELLVESAGARGVGSAIDACAITTPGWSAGEALSFDEAPQWDATRCVTGLGSATRWRFDLSGLASPHGIALVPAQAAPPDFQVAFLA